MRFTLLSVAILPFLSFNVRADAIDDYAVGRKGVYLKRTIQTRCRPLQLCETAELADCLLPISNIDLISGLPLNGSADYSILPIIPGKWYGVNPQFKDETGRDLINLCITESELADLRASFPFYDVENASSSGAGWSFGNTEFYGDNRFKCLEPRQKGEIARSIFYTITIYPATIWTDWGDVMFESNEYPTLSKFAMECYMQWHRDYPVSQSEVDRNSSIETVQHNRNPFVDHPDLAEYLWGEHAGEPYRQNPDDDNPQNPDKPRPLKSRYTAEDIRIDLYSPYIPADASWKIDGIPTSDKSISTAELGLGKHEFSYQSGALKGKLIIIIES